jgi:saccharopine dehydrogenase (NAD+, L-lysine forming)
MAKLDSPFVLLNIDIKVVLAQPTTCLPTESTRCQKPVDPIFLQIYNNFSSLKRTLPLFNYPEKPILAAMEKIRIGVLKEEKNPPDKRVPLSPLICEELLEMYSNLEIYIQKSDIRCYSDDEYRAFGLNVVDDVSHCDILMGVKEVPKDKLMPNKKYFFFSHTIKAQPHNKELMKTLIAKQIEMIDYECLTDKFNQRIIGFGRYAGIVGAYNGILGYGKKYNLFQLKPANICRDRNEMDEELKRAKLPNIKICVTGNGRVANGVIDTLSTMRIRKVTPFEFLNCEFKEPVYCQLLTKDYVENKVDGDFCENKFKAQPDHYISTFGPYLSVTNLLMTAHYWDPRSPKLFTKEEMQTPEFKISVIADITCDVDGSVPSTIRATSITKPFFGYNPKTKQEDITFSKDTVLTMAVDNLPCELPRNASDDFGRDLMDRVLVYLLKGDPDKVIERATICKNGQLTEKYNYLNNYAFN